MPRDGTPTRENILDTAEYLVLDQGFSATPVEQIIADSATSKGAFFHHFDSKPALATALATRYAAADVDTLTQVLAYVEAQFDDPAERLIELVRVYEDGGDEVMAGQSGCLYATVLSERALLDAGAREPIAAALEQWRIALTPLLTQALATRKPRTRVDTEALVDHFFATFEGAFLLRRATGDESHMRRQLAVLRQLLQALLDT